MKIKEVFSLWFYFNHIIVKNGVYLCITRVVSYNRRTLLYLIIAWYIIDWFTYSKTSIENAHSKNSVLYSNSKHDVKIESNMVWFYFQKFSKNKILVTSMEIEIHKSLNITRVLFKINMKKILFILRVWELQHVKMIIWFIFVILAGYVAADSNTTLNIGKFNLTSFRYFFSYSFFIFY